MISPPDRLFNACENTTDISGTFEESAAAKCFVKLVHHIGKAPLTCAYGKTFYRVLKAFAVEIFSV